MTPGKAAAGRALVTGASGFIGSAVVRALAARGYVVRALIRSPSRAKQVTGRGVELAVGDISDPGSVREAMSGCQLCFHVAALYSFWVADPARVYVVNVDGTRNVLEAACQAGVDSVVHTSSVATVGTAPSGRPADESVTCSPPALHGHYKLSKYLAEQVAQAYAERGLPVVIVNPAFPVGPGDWKPTPTGQMILDFLRGKMPAYVDTGMSVVDVDDVALGHLLAAQRGRPGQRYILGGENLRMREVLSLLGDITGRPAPRVRLPRRPLLALAHANVLWHRVFGGVPRMTPETVHMAGRLMFYDSGRASRELGYAPRPAREALSRAVAWFREHGYLDPQGRKSVSLVT
ncbi:MAG: hopanoid-associated sugar epimerase [Candidatus Bipolaricaulaceae bacterium]